MKLPDLAVFDRALFSLACVAGALILVLQLAEIGLRLLGSSLPFVSETVGFLMAALTFLGLPEVTRRHEHLTADFVLALMPPRLRRLIEGVLSPFAFAIYAVLLIWLMSALAEGSWTDDVRSEGITRTPLWIPQGIILLGLLTTLLRLSVQILAGLRGHVPMDDTA